MKNKLIGIAMVLVAVTALAGCGGDNNNSSASTPPETSAPAASSSAGGTSGGETKELDAPIAETPILLTSVGQSADVEMVKNLLDRVDLSATTNKLVTSADIGDAKTLILAVGGSSKGLGAAGIDADEELARVQELIDAADSQGLVIIAVHIGGSNRRGELSDKFIGPSFAKADYAVVVAEGDQDGMMSGLAAENGIPIAVVDTMAEAGEPLKAAFK